MTPARDIGSFDVEIYAVETIAPDEVSKMPIVHPESLLVGIKTLERALRSSAEHSQYGNPCILQCPDLIPKPIEAGILRWMVIQVDNMLGFRVVEVYSSDNDMRDVDLGLGEQREERNKLSIRSMVRLVIDDISRPTRRY